MMTLTLIRKPSTDEGTFGKIVFDGNHTFYTLELPWKNNQRRISCIPEGTYPARWDLSTRFGWCYHIEPVPGRSDILIHPGNLAGDESKGLTSHVEGCILLGAGLGKIGAQNGVIMSRSAVDQFTSMLRHQDFTLKIQSLPT